LFITLSRTKGNLAGATPMSKVAKTRMKQIKAVFWAGVLTIILAQANGKIAFEMLARLSRSAQSLA
jgi:hypothetical protein